MVRRQLALDEERLVEVGLGVLLHHRGPERQVADVVLVELERQLALDRQGVERGRHGEQPVDQLLRHAVAADEIEPDVLQGIPQFAGAALERARCAREMLGEVDDGNLGVPGTVLGRSHVRSPSSVPRPRPARNQRRCMSIPQFPVT
jgi:hypothetical protein